MKKISKKELLNLLKENQIEKAIKLLEKDLNSSPSLNKAIKRYALKVKRFNKKERPNIAGAYELNNKTMLGTSCNCIVFNEVLKMEGLAKVEVGDLTNRIDFEKLILNNDDYKQFPIEIPDKNSLKEKLDLRENVFIELKGKDFLIEQILLISDCLKNPKYYTSENQFGFLFIEGENGIGIITPMIKKMKG